MAIRSTTAERLEQLRATARTNPFEVVLWLSPLAVVTFLYSAQRVSLVSVTLLTAGLIGVGLVVLASRHPIGALTSLLVLVPFQTMLLSLVYRFGLPASLVRPLSSWKELVGLGVLIAAARTRTRDRRTLDRIDVIALSYVALVAAYALVPRFFVTTAPLDDAVRANAFRFNAAFVLLFLAARHLDLTPEARGRLLRVALVVGTVVAALGLVEFASPGWWNDIAIRQVQVTKYLVEVTGGTPRDVHSILTYTPFGGTQLLRIGSVLFSPLTVGFFMVGGYAVACERVVMDRARGVTVLALAVLTSAIVLTQTRSAILAMIVVTLLALRPRAGRASVGRARFSLLLVLLVVIAIPLALSSGLSQRITGANSSNDTSSQDHVNSLQEAVTQIVNHPLGTGLGTSGSTSVRYEVSNSTITENFYLQAGVETGVLALVLFLAFTLVVLERLGRVAARSTEADVHAAHGALVGLAVAALFLHVWQELAVSWTMWILAGIAVAVERSHDDSSVADRNQASNRRPIPLAR